MKGRILIFIGFSFLFAFLFFNANVFCQTIDFNIISQGDMDGHNGYYRTMVIDDSLFQTDFEFAEVDYIRAYAYKMSWDMNYHILPDSTYLSKVNNLHIGDTWKSWVFEPVTALVADTVTLNLPLGNYFAYKTIFTTISGDTNFVAWGSMNIGGVQLITLGYFGILSDYTIVGGQGFWPLAVGNHWRYSIVTSIDDNHSIATLPLSIDLNNYPNPFNVQTTIHYNLPITSEVSINIFDILGHKVETLVSSRQSAGSHSVIWNAKNATSGIYFYKIQTGDNSESRKCLLLK